MKKLLVMTALLAVAVSAQADNRFWVGDYVNGNASATWGTGDSWWDGATGFGVPTAGDTAFIMDVITGIPVSHNPVVDSSFAGIKPDFLFIGWDNGSTGTLDFSFGGHLETGHTRVGNGVGAMGTLNMMDSWTYMKADTFELGYNLVQYVGTPTNHLAASADGYLNIGGNATLHASTFYFGQESAHYGLSGTNGTAAGVGYMTMTGGGDGVGARFIVDGDLTSATGDGRADTWINNGWITATGAGDSIVATTTGTWTEFNVIPEPATLSMVALIGGGMLWIRKRFTI